MVEQLIAIFCDVDDFCKGYEDYCTAHLLMDKCHIVPKTSMALSEIMTITIFFRLSGYRCFKWYYQRYICGQMKEYFPRRLSYNRFVEVMPSILAPLTLCTIGRRLGKSSGVNFADSTTFEVCDPHRIHSNRVFKGLAERGKSSTGWFYGFKLHLSINDRGEILSFCITPGNMDDRDEKVIRHLTKEMWGKLFDDNGLVRDCANAVCL